MASKNYPTKLILLFVYGLCLLVSAVAELPRFDHPVNKPDGSLHFLVLGDWGRRGQFNQTQVAAQMGKFGEKVDLDFIISTGDNFYDSGLTGIDDSAFEESFSNVYSSPGLQKQWYIVLGNHDYRGDALAQLDPIQRQKDKRWFCMRSYILNTDVAEFFLVDTTPFVDKYFTDPKDQKYDWRGVLPREDYLSNLLEDLDRALKESSSSWKIVVGHHTIKSGGYHGNTLELEERLLPILLENNVDLYINGHDHCLEHITTFDSPIQFLTSGGGSKAWKNKFHPVGPNDLKFYYDGQGFMSMKITKADIHFEYYDIFGNVLHQWSVSKGLNPI